MASALLIALGLAVHFGGHEMNKQLWTVSYALFMAGTCGAFLLMWYAMVDWRQGRARDICAKVLSPLQKMGQNSILIFFWHGLASQLLGVIYWQPDNAGEKHNLIGWLREDIFGEADTLPAGQLAFVICKIACFAAGCWYCASIGYFWKL